MGETALIYPAIAGVMSEIGAVGKNKRNTTQGFQYRGIDDVMNAINPALINHKVFVVPEVLDVKREDRVTLKGNPIIYSIATVRYTFFAEDGSNVQAVVIGEGMDSGDKSMNKAMSIAFKYACFQVLCIPTEEMKDPDAESHDLAPRGTQAATPPPQQRTSAPPASRSRQASTARTKTQAPPAQEPQMETDPSKVLINQNHIAVLKKEMERTGITEHTLLTMFKVDSMESMTMAMFTTAKAKFAKTADKQPAPAPEPKKKPDNVPEIPDNFNPLTAEEELELPFV